MKKNSRWSIFGFVLILVSLLTLIVFLVSRYVQPILPPTTNYALVLAIASLMGVLGLLASLNEIVELASKIRETSRSTRKKRQEYQLTNSSGAKVSICNDSSSSKPISISVNQLRKHFALVGNSGTGKTIVIYSLLKKLWLEHKIPFIIPEIEYQSEYQALFSNDPMLKDEVQELDVNGKNLFGINPFLSYSSPLVGEKQDRLLESFKCAYAWPQNFIDVVQEAIRLSFQLHSLHPNDTLPIALEVPNMLTFHSMATTQAVDSLSDKFGVITPVEMKMYAIMKLIHLTASDRVQKLFVETKDNIILDNFLQRPATINLTTSTHGRDYNVFVAFLILSRLLEQIKSLPKSDELKLVLVLENLEKFIGFNKSEELDEKEKLKNQYATKFFHEFAVAARESGVGIIWTTHRPSGISNVVVRDVRNFLLFRTSRTEIDFLSDVMNIDTESKNDIPDLIKQNAFFFSDGNIPTSKVVIPKIEFEKSTTG